MRILVVEDEKKIADFIKRGLKEEGYSVDTANDGDSGYFLAGTNDYDAIVLDLMLPKTDGLTVCKKIRADKNRVPIIILTAKNTVADKVAGLDVGADDYLTKPFAFAELLARLRSVMRKNEGQDASKLLVNDLVMDLISHKVFRAGKEIELTAKEYSLLEYLMRNAGRVVTRTSISEHVWDISFDTDTNVIDVYVNYLRKKIDKGPSRKLISTVRGRGYILKAD
jgi:heavy metal response regulator